MATNNSTLYLMSYNNYYNRIVKREATLDDYPISADYVPLVCNFNPADGIDTEHIMNVPYIANTPEADYVVVVGEDGQINSRWFIVNATRTRGGQYRLSLHRDLIADFYDAVVSSPTYIERAMLPLSSPFIYNSENMSFNQIKTAEYPLMDATQTPWIVIYFDRNQTEQKTITSRANVIDNTELTYEYDNIVALKDKKLYGSILSDNTVKFMTLEDTTQAPAFFTWWYNNLGEYEKRSQLSFYNTPFIEQYGLTKRQKQEIADTFKESITSTIQSSLNSNFYTMYGNNVDTIASLKALSGKTIKDSNSDTLYTFQLELDTEEIGYWLNVGSGMYNTLKDIIGNLPYITLSSSENTNSSIYVSTDVVVAKITAIEVVNGMELSVSIPAASNRTQLTDAPWDMLAIPYNGDIWVRTSPTMRTSTLPNVARAIAQAAQAQMGDFVKDVQLLPYCPCMEYVSGGILNISNLTNGVNYVAINSESEGDANWGVWCNQSSFRVNITNFTPIINPQDPVEFKVNNECDMYRLVSPNYAGAFEFSATRNGGITGFEVNCTYKPFQPYVHINPIFGKLYGKDFNDNRGLVCGGNFSMPSLTNAWTEYQIQNKSYKESFDRQITNMERTYDIQREQMKTAGVIGAITAGISGATAGAMTGSIGGLVGAIPAGITGAAIGGIASGIGLAQDLKYAEQLQNEALSYTKDQFNLSLQNIKALPNTIANVGAFDINYKYFPFLEYYTCSDAEKEALRQKIRYNGMAVNAIGTLDDYQSGFVQGQVIRLEGITEDFHCAAAIANEIHKGVYI